VATDRRAFLSLLASSLLAPDAFAGPDGRPCHPPRYEAWTGRRERWWPERVGAHGFVNYYGEPFSFDDALTVPQDGFPSCLVWGAELSTLDDRGPVRRHLQATTFAGAPASTNCHRWPSEADRELEVRAARLLTELRAACPAPSRPAPRRFVAVASHHSSSDVYRRPDETPATAVRIDGLHQVITHRPEWRPEALNGAPHALVGAGIKVCHLNEVLWENRLALETQGSFDGQSLAGAISTGTHGAGADVGAIADSVRAIVVATCVPDLVTGAPTWQILQVEPDPAEALSDPARFPTERGGATWRLVQSTALFEGLLVPMGTMGVILAYVVRVRSAYFLRELRVGRPWSEVKQNLTERALLPTNGFTPVGWRYELAVNPNRSRKSDDWVCTEVYRDAWDYDLDYLSEVRAVPDKWLGDVTRNVNLGGALSNTITRAADDGLAKGRRLGWFADRCYRVLKLGQGEYVQAWGMEAMIPAERGAELISWILERNPTQGEFRRGHPRGLRLLNPFGVRFARGRQGFLSPTRRYVDGQPGLTCTVELTDPVKDGDEKNLGPRKNGKPASKALVESWAEAFVQEFGPDARLHWGQLQGAYGEAELRAGYPNADVEGFYQAFRALNPFGLFDNAFCRRVGFAQRRDADASPTLLTPAATPTEAG
jgi:FAD/FMN-containing dehydrogenase